MSLMGTRVGPYTIVDRLGEGGMGEVYRAHDPTLNRQVAIKFLLPAITAAPDRMARFRREAQALAAVNHPNIASVHGFELSGETPALVMELVEGPTLLDRLAEGALPIPKALDIARQIAGALEAAHAAGIVHRDLKPANIKLRRDGTVKVLDFGLAKVLAEDSAASAPADRVTVTGDATRPGLTLGTPAYMSPEQARGDPVDKRTDVWAFGCVLYELLTGQRAFAGRTTSDTIAALLEREPDWSALPAATPAAVRRLLERCLSKDPSARRRDIGDIRLELEDLLRVPGRTDREAPVPLRRWHGLVPWAGWLAATLAVALLILGTLDGPRAPADARVVTLSVAPPKGTTFPFELGAPWPSISPDGRQLAFVALSPAGEQSLWLRPLASTTARPLEGSEGAMRPFWSPDSRSLAYFARGKLWRIDLPAGAPQEICDAPYTGDMAGTWGDGVVLFSGAGGLQTVPENGGRPTPLPLGDESVIQRNNPAFLPDGRQFLFLDLTNSAQADEGRICLASLDSPRPVCATPANSAAKYGPPGHLLFVRHGVLRAQSFDPGRALVAGEAHTIPGARIVTEPAWRPPSFSVSDNGVLAWHPSLGETQLVWVNREGQPVATVGPVDSYGGPSTTPDGTRVVVSRRDLETGTTSQWLFDASRGAPSRLTFGPAPSRESVISADGLRIVFASIRDGAFELRTRLTSGAGAEETLITARRSLFPTDWSPDEQYVIYQAYDPETSWDVWALPLSGDRKPIPIGRTEHGEREGQLSPDLRWIAYDSSESGRREVWIQLFPPTGGRWQVSTGGGFSPRWRGDSRELYYVAADGRMMAVPIGAGSTPEPGAAQVLFQTMFREGAYGSYAVSGDGQRFLMRIPPEPGDVTPISVIVNWPGALTK